jgi:LysR family transcriptional regulator, hydrogen peroxide-inducible genes activator
MLPPIRKGKNQNSLKPEDLDLDRLWLLEEGHCLRSQIAALCELKKQNRSYSNLVYEAGSIDSLKRLVDSNAGITIMPALAIRDYSADELESVQFFRDPVPARQISIVTYRHHLKERIVDVLKEEIQKKVAPILDEGRRFKILAV